jgi:3-oxoacyl-[acyl-carrier protein] reductase
METADRPLAGKVAVVTGAGRGIGRAIALAYAGAGAAVACAARTLPEIEDTAREILESGGNAIAVQTDVTRLESARALFAAAAERFGRVDIAVLNAGGNFDREPVETSDPEAWCRTLEVNLTGAYYCAQAAIPYLRQAGAGKIITVGSGLGRRGTAGSSAYACSKAGLWMLTRVLAQELLPYNISVNELIPGPVRTTIDDAFGGRGSRISGIESEWVKRPEDVVPLALFLACQPDVGPTAQSYSLMRRDM